MIIERVSNGRLFPALLNGRHRIANHVSWTTISVIDASLSPDPTESPRAPRIPTSIGLLPRSHDPTLHLVFAPKTAFDGSFSTIRFARTTTVLTTQ